MEWSIECWSNDESVLNKYMTIPQESDANTVQAVLEMKIACNELRLFAILGSMGLPTRNLSLGAAREDDYLGADGLEYASTWSSDSFAIAKTTREKT